MIRPSRRPAARGFDLVAGFLVDDAKDRRQVLAHGVVGRPTGQVLGDDVEKRHAALGVGGDHAIADADQRGPEQFAVLVDVGGRSVDGAGSAGG